MGSLNSAVTFSDSCTPPLQLEIKRNKDHGHQRSKWLSMEKTITGLRPVLQSGNEIPGGSPHICAALVAVINSEFPDVGLLLVKRVVLQFKEAYDCSNKKEMEAALKFLAHLVNQAVVYELVAFDVLLLLLGRPSSDHIELAVSFCIECGSSLLEFSPCRLNERFEEYPRMTDELDFVEVEDQVTHEVSLLHEICSESSVDSFKAEKDQSFEHEMCSEIVIPCDDDDEVSSGGV
ncbi:UNVERIFIED_CONTAM: Pre-splicing factor CWC22 [Sesamum calycinum]|uniref:Pre-splicing factor CWC22 n=1 Tax=Sesamum calycinum TaxID=2727403 RepID=A0AAW2SY46_9LAMI